MIVEDGTIVSGANSYVPMTYADEYHAARNNSAWADGVESPDDAREGALIRATAWLDGTYRNRYPGAKAAGRSQPLEWPRKDATDVNGDEIAEDEIPVEIKNAVCEAALRELAAPGSMSPDYVAAERVIREKVGELETEYSESNRGSQDALPVVSAIDGILSSLFGTSRAGVLWGTQARG